MVHGLHTKCRLTLSVRAARSAAANCGWQALHVAIDDHSRLAFSRMLPNQQAQTAIAFLHAAVAFYAQHGISIRRLLTDNGSCYRSRLFRDACLQLGIQHRFTRRTSCVRNKSVFPSAASTVKNCSAQRTSSRKYSNACGSA